MQYYTMYNLKIVLMENRLSEHYEGGVLHIEIQKYIYKYQCLKNTDFLKLFATRRNHPRLRSVSLCESICT